MENSSADVTQIFNMARLQAHSFSQITKIKTYVLDHENDDNKYLCRFCKNLMKQQNSDTDCYYTVYEMSQKAFSFGGLYVFLCKTGFLHIISPIVNNSTMIGTIITGPIVIEADINLFTENIKKNFSDMPHKDLYKSALTLSYSNVFDLSLTVGLFKTSFSFPFSRYNHEYMFNYSADPFWDCSAMEIKISKYIISHHKAKIKILIASKYSGIKKYYEDDFNGLRNHTVMLFLSLCRIFLYSAPYAGDPSVYTFFRDKILQLKECIKISDFNKLVVDVTGHFADFVIPEETIKENDVITSAKDYIEKNYMNKISLQLVASNVYLSPSYLSRLFKVCLGCSFNEYVNKIRIINAKKLLKNENIPLSKIAGLVGFDEQSYFSKVFKKFAGQSPKSFKENYTM